MFCSVRPAAVVDAGTSSAELSMRSAAVRPGPPSTTLSTSGFAYFPKFHRHAPATSFGKF